MREKLWLAIVSIDSTDNSIENLIDKLREKIIEQFVTNIFVEKNDFESYSNLIQKLSSIENLTWKQQTFAIGLLTYLLREDVPICLSTIQLFLQSLRHQCEQIRKVCSYSNNSFFVKR